MKGGGGRRKLTKKTTPATSDLPKQKQKAVQNEQENEYEDNDDEQEQVPELAEGYYIIEAIRKKRVHKGVTQYLIKWQGWPESANTWEPVENLSVCPELIEAFEESKNRSKGKRKSRHAGATMSRSKKEATPQMQQQVPEDTYKEKQQVQEQFSEDTYPVPAVQLTILEKPCVGRCVHMPNMSNVAENTVVGTTDIGNANPSNNTVSVTGSLENGEKEEVSKSDVEVIDPKATSSKDEESMADFGIHIQEDAAAENGISIVDTTEVLRTSPRLGIRRRKPYSVKRFKKDPNSFPKKDAAVKTTAASAVVVQDINNGGDMENGLDSENAECPQSVSVITKIVKPVNYSTSILNGAEEVCVSFLVRRSDGEEVVVDNKYLKENNPFLLINFYEQHLRYNNPSE